MVVMLVRKQEIHGLVKFCPIETVCTGRKNRTSTKGNHGSACTPAELRCCSYFMYLVSLYSASNIFKLSLGKKGLQRRNNQSEIRTNLNVKAAEKTKDPKQKKQKICGSKMLNSVLMRGALRSTTRLILSNYYGFIKQDPVVPKSHV